MRRSQNPASFLDTYWACSKIAEKYNAEFNDGLNNQLSHYAIGVLTEVFDVAPDAAQRAFE
jgi:hypothetical protein